MARLEHHGSVDGGQMLPVTQLDFEQAMRDFKTMFPLMEEDVIEMVLRSNNGAVDVTIDQLLAMSVETEQQEKSKPPPPLSSASRAPLLSSQVEKICQSNDEIPPSYSTGFTPPPTYQQAVPLNMPDMLMMMPDDSSSGLMTFAGSGESLRRKFKWNPPLVGRLPDNFLRIDGFNLNRRIIGPDGGFPGYPTLSWTKVKQSMQENERQRKLSKDIEDVETAQYLEDERIAIFLQNEEFVRELKRNKDFMSTLNMDTALQPRRAVSGEEDGGLPEGPSVPCHEDDAAFKEKLKNMGKASRRKFAQFAKLFSRRRRPSFPHILGGSHGGDASNSGRENLFSDDTYTQLENEGSDTESINRTYFETYPDEEELERNPPPGKHRSHTSHS